MRRWLPWRREKRAEDSSWAALIDRGALSSSGPHVDAKAAESIAAVFGCVQALSESTATLPLHVFRRSDSGERVRDDDHPLAHVLRNPNPHQSGLAFRESLTASVLLHGNGYARIERDRAGDLVALHPMDPRGVTVVALGSGRYRYDYTDEGRVERLLEDEVLHLADRTEAGSIIGKSRIAIARDTLGLGLSLREHGAATFRNGTRLSGVLSTPHVLDAGSAERIGESWQSQFGGAGNVARTAILENGLTYQQMAMTLEDSAWIAGQQFSVEEVCRIYRVPPTMVGDLRHGSYQNTAELGSQFVRYSLQRWIAMWEAEIARQLLGPITRRRYHAEHSVEGLLRGNPEARADFYTKAIEAGWMLRSEVRRLENLPELEGLDDERSD